MKRKIERRRGGGVGRKREGERKREGRAKERLSDGRWRLGGKERGRCR